MAEETDFFLSHDWGTDEIGRANHARVSKINSMLQELGFDTWFDQDMMSGDIIHQMAAGIEKTKVVLVFVTKRYCEKVNAGSPGDNCELEFDHAVRVTKTNNMLAIVMESGMSDTSSWRGKVGMQLGNKLYVELSGNVNDPVYLKQKCQNIIDVAATFPNLRDICEAGTQTPESEPPSKAEAANEAKAKRAKSSRGQIKFTVWFTNRHDQDIDLIWKDYQGNEVIVRQGVSPGSRHGEDSFFTHPFIARDVVTEKVVLMTSGSVTGPVFEGLNFGAPHNGHIEVTIGGK
eukprot:gene11111-12281_t